MKRILVIDDDNDGSSILKITLEKKGHICEHIFQDENVMDFINKFKPDIIVFDVFSRNKAGNDLLQKLKNNQEISHIPIYPYFSNRFESSLDSRDASDHILSEELLSLIKTNLQKNKN